MAATTSSLLTWNDELIKVELDSPYDEVLDNMPFMSGPLPVLLIVAFYLYFVLSLGPKLMEGRKPFNLKYVLIVYNLFNVCTSLYLVGMLFFTPGGLSYIVSNNCTPPRRKNNPFVDPINFGGWLYFFSKIVELLDTVFFVMRKKNNQITLLHVYHHSNMVLSCWAYMKYVRGEQGVLIGVINSAVHIVMYSYYLLAALGPSIQKYLWWKKYITKIQLVQFFIILFYLISLLVKNCNFPKIINYYAVSQTIIFIVLFTDFYIKAYKKKDSTNKVKSS